VKVIPLFSQSWESNSFLLIHEGKALLIDAGAAPQRVTEALSESDATLVGIALTHGHFDHILSMDKLRDLFGVPVYLHKADAEMPSDSEQNAYEVFFGAQKCWRPADRLLNDGDSIPFGDKSLTVISTPGHTEGSVCYLTDDILFSGDTVFAGGVGRTDLYGGDMGALGQSLKKILSLPGHLTVYAGHGGSTTLRNIVNNLMSNFE
jgi:glyoxylase-like metal-dependent hydrolase (beta-lactamase superfamily II)